MPKEQDKKELSGDELEGSSRQAEISEEALEGVSGRGAEAMKGPLRKLSTVVDATDKSVVFGLGRERNQ